MGSVTTGNPWRSPGIDGVWLALLLVGEALSDLRQEVQLSALSLNHLLEVVRLLLHSCHRRGPAPRYVAHGNR